MKTGNQIVKEILEFYQSKTEVERVELDANEYIIDESRVVHVTYYKKGSKDISDRILVAIFWDEEDAHYDANSKKNIIAKIDKDSNFIQFDKDELEFFYTLSFTIEKKAERETNQVIEDWF